MIATAREIRRLIGVEEGFTHADLDAAFTACCARNDAIEDMTGFADIDFVMMGWLFSALWRMDEFIWADGWLGDTDEVDYCRPTRYLRIDEDFPFGPVV